MLDAFRWLLTVEIIGLAAFPLVHYLMPRLADRGYAFSKPFGILLASYLFWVLGLAHIPTGRPTAFVLVALIAAAAAFLAYIRRDSLRRFILREWRTILVIEAVFLAFFIGWALFRSADPFINHTEQPMDLALLSASINSQTGHPEDPWLRGESISYYYFGYWMMGMLSQLAGIQSNISYNLAMALIPAMAAAGIFGVVYNIVRAGGDKWRLAIVGGGVAAVLLGVAANLEGVAEFMRLNGMGSQGFWDWLRIQGLEGANPDPPASWAPSEHWWWFRTSRVINTFDGAFFVDNTIQEFPFFSFILGDMHPHVMSIPFVTLFIGMTLNLYRTPTAVWREYRSVYLYAAGLAAALLLGGLGFNNLWDMPTFAALLIAALTLRHYVDGRSVWESVQGALFPLGIVVCALAVLMYAPYLLNLSVGVGGIGGVSTHTRPVHMFIVWGLFFAAIAPMLVVVFLRTTVQRDWFAVGATALMLAFAPWLLWTLQGLTGGGGISDAVSAFVHILPLSALAAAGIYNALYLARRPGSDGLLYATLLAVLGLGLLIGSEFLFVRDFFDNRGNTVFKLYYQAWILLAAASAFAVCWWLRGFRITVGRSRALHILWAAAFLILLAGSFYYPLAAIKTKPDTPVTGRTLDGLSFVHQSRPAEYAAIEYLRQNAPQDAAIVEAVGEWFDWGMISRSTGLPTIVNWLGHQKQWRGGWGRFDAPTAGEVQGIRDAYFAARESEVALIYTTHDPAEAKAVLGKYDVTYIYIGHRERDKYGTTGIAKFDEIADTVFHSTDASGDVIIYRVRR